MKKIFTCMFLFGTLFTLKAQYTATNIISGLDYPTIFTIAPDGRYFMSLKGGGNDPAVNASIDVYNSNGTFQAKLWDFTDSTEVYFERGVLGVELDPDFANNHFVYVFYNHKITTSRIRVVRLTETNGVGSNPTMIFDINDPHTAGNHTGGNIHFGPDGKLYITIGDRATMANSQDITNNPFGKYLRLNADGTIPTDNPFYDDGNPATLNDDRIWTYGHRNSFDFTFSTVNDSLYASENGLNTWDEINLVMKGENYGWPTCEGFFNINSTTVDCSLPTAIDPLDDFSGPPAVTGIVLYDHTLMPEFTNHLLVTDYNDGNITNFTLGNAPAYDTVTARSIVSVALSTLGLTDIVVGNEGCLYVVEGGYTPNGKLTRICPTGMSIDEETFNAFSIFPNPANEIVTLGISEPLLNGTLVIRDILGRTIIASSVTSTNQTVDVSTIEKGVYLISIEKNGKTLSQKLIVE